ncbi:MAG: sulfurase [Pseudomonadota bacterium]|nr:sulfurase [Pseudomonadota bacterium]
MSEYFDEAPYEARITWLGHVADRKAALASEGQDTARLTFAGIEGEDHGGVTRPACSRVSILHPKGTEIRNTRQLTVLAAEQIDKIAENMGLDHFDPAWIGVSVVVEGIPDFSYVPSSSRLQMPDGATLTVDMVNHPCTLSGRSVENFAPGYGPKFKPAAVDLRGVTAWVEREGTLNVGDKVRLFVPKQRPWQP